MSVALYGLANCDTCRKARRLLESEGVDVEFYDLRKDKSDSEGRLDPELAAYFFANADWQVLLNKRSTSWRQLAEDERAHLDASSAQALCIKHPTLLKRPLLDTGEQLVVGLDKDAYARLAHS